MGFYMIGDVGGAPPDFERRLKVGVDIWADANNGDIAVGLVIRAPSGRTSVDDTFYVHVGEDGIDRLLNAGDKATLKRVIDLLSLLVERGVVFRQGGE